VVRIPFDPSPFEIIPPSVESPQATATPPAEEKVQEDTGTQH